MKRAFVIGKYANDVTLTVTENDPYNEHMISSFFLALYVWSESHPHIKMSKMKVLTVPVQNFTGGRWED